MHVIVARRRWVAGFSAMLLIAAVLAIFLPFRQALTITEVETGRLLVAVGAEEGDAFEIAFIHSVHRTPVEEYYRISADGAIVLEKVVYETYGIGNPSAPEPGQRFRVEDGKMIIENMNRRLPALNQRIGQLVADHQWVWRGRSIPFSSFGEPGSLVSIKTARVSPWDLWRGGAKGDRE
ncbi:DUF1850 domain-containing protein [Paenibacillus sp. TRM 82003]|nr:DUF1850 domain-containing protein [Paenibacillus sp. TRM 82003]